MDAVIPAIRSIKTVSFLPAVWFVMASVVTYLAFFAPGVSFGWILLPFAMGIISPSRSTKFACGAGYFCWVTVISGWGLLKLGYSAGFVIPAGILLTSVAGLMVARLGVGLTSLLLFPIHMLPGNPLLAAGTVFPGAGPYAVVFLGLAAFLVERLRQPQQRAIALAGLTGIGNIAGLLFTSFLSQGDRGPEYRTLDVTSILAITEYGYNQALAGFMSPGATYITGENIIGSSDSSAISQWCRLVRSKDLTVYLGVQNARDGQAQIWLFDPRSCLNPAKVYAAKTGIPGITGSIQQMPGTQTQDEIAFLACFEGFSIWRWFQIAQDQPEIVVTIAKDIWTEPLQVGRLRRKISRQFERLLDLPSFHAETGKTLLEQIPNNEVNS
jgi:hypothetical protein